MTDTRAWDRRTLIATGGALLAPVLSRGRAETPAPSPRRCADFLDAIGVNIHLRYVQTQYNDVAAVIAAMKYIGVTHARDAAPDFRAPNDGHYGALAAAGVRFCLLWGARRDMGDAIRQVAALQAAHPGAVDALEGPNEIKPDFAYGGAEGIAAGQKFMADMRAEAARTPAVAALPLVNFTSYAPAAADCDFANQHPYPKGGAQPAALLRAQRDRYVGPGGVMPGKPMMFTEFGYHTLVGKPTREGPWQGVDEESQAVMLVNGWLDCVAGGVTRVYVYQLFDATPDRGGPPNQEHHFGLFRINGSPKPAATAFRTLARLLADPGPRARAFTPAPIAARVVLGQNLSCLPLRDSAGRAFLVFWNESPIWDKDTAGPRPSESAAASVTLAKAAPMRTVDVIMDGRTTDLGVAASVVVNVGAHPVVLCLG